MSGLIGKKIGMTSFFDANGKYVPCTVIEVGPCVVTQVKTNEKDGYSALQLAFDEKKEKHTSSAMKGHFELSKTTPKRKIVEFRSFEETKNLGDIITVELFAEGEYVDIVGTSKGKGFQGVVKRHGFGGVGGSTHGQHDRSRAFLFTCGERNTVNILLFVGNGIGPLTTAPVNLTVFTIFSADLSTKL